MLFGWRLINESSVVALRVCDLELPVLLFEQAMMTRDGLVVNRDLVRQVAPDGDLVPGQLKNSPLRRPGDESKIRLHVSTRINNCYLKLSVLIACISILI